MPTPSGSNPDPNPGSRPILDFSSALGIRPFGEAVESGFAAPPIVTGPDGTTPIGPDLSRMFKDKTAQRIADLRAKRMDNEPLPEYADDWNRFLTFVDLDYGRLMAVEYQNEKIKDCWGWIPSIRSGVLNGSFHMSAGRGTVSAIRFAWEAFNYDQQVWVRGGHKCRNKEFYCVRPSHISHAPSITEKGAEAERKRAERRDRRIRAKEAYNRLFKDL